MLDGRQQAERTLKRPSHPMLSRARLAASTLLSSDELEALEGIALAPRSVRAGDDLLREGEAADQLHFVIEGWAYRFKTTRGGARQIVGLTLPGDLANLDSFLFSRPDYGVRALTPATVVAVPRDRLLALSAEHSGVARALTWTGLVENATLSQWALCLGRYSAQQRLAHLLCELAVRSVGSGDASVTFTLPMTQEHLADALGLTPVHLNRVMQQFRADGLIVTANRLLTIPDMARLREVGGFDPAYLHGEGDGPTPALSPVRQPSPMNAGF